MNTMTYDERMEDLRVEYNNFLETKRGQEWQMFWKEKLVLKRAKMVYEDRKQRGLRRKSPILEQRMNGEYK